MSTSRRILAALLVLATAGSALPAVAQESHQPVPQLFPFRDSGKDGKWGFIDSKGITVTQPKYHWADYFQEGRALVWTEGPQHTGAYIDEKDRVVFQLPRNYAEAHWFSGGLAWFCSAYPELKYGCNDRDGKLVIRPKYDDVGDFSEGLARVNQGAKPRRPWGLSGGKWGYVDKLGHEVIPLQFDKAEDFRAGQAEVRIGQRSFFIDAIGQEIVTPKTARRPRATEDLPPNLVRMEDGTRRRVNDRRAYCGELAEVHLGGAVVPVMDAPVYWAGGAWYYVNRKGEIVRRKCDDPEH